MKGHSPLILFSGLPLDRKPSFLRQLGSLAAVWRRQGRSVFLAGPVRSDSESEMGKAPGTPGVRWRLEDVGRGPLAFQDAVARTAAKAVIALGYPDQFPFIHGALLPCYLWSQFSRAPRHRLPARPTFIPLTEKTASHLRTAGCSRIGPVIAHGVDTRLFAPLPELKRRALLREHGFGDTFVIGTVANNTRRKRIDLIVRSFALFSRECPSSRLLIKTDRPVSLDGIDLPSLVAREHVRDRVEVIVAELTDPQMRDLYNRMDLYLNLSEWEGFCIPVIEAMACAVAVVSPAIQGPGEILPYPDTLILGGQSREEDGTLLYAADPRSVCEVLTALAENRGLRKRLGREGREAALSRYEIRRVAVQWEQVLQSM